MRRIKSAPANICLMNNNKKSEKDYIIPRKENKSIKHLLFAFNNVNNVNNVNKYTKFKTIKQVYKNTFDIIGDIIGDNKYIQLEELSIYNFIVGLFNDNILKKKKFTELKYYLFQAFIKYLVMLFIHTQILHDKYIDIQCITTNLHILTLAS